MSAELVMLIPPGPGGVRDYAEVMATHVPTRLLPVTPETPLADYGEGDILLHFSGYGYQSRGVPTWLVQRLRQLKSKPRRVGVYFHELFASGPPWRSAFWLHVVQRQIAVDLVRLADFWMTNRQSSETWLNRHSSRVPRALLPVISNVGEPELITVRDKRKVVVFGGAASRALAYQAMDEKFWKWCVEGGFEVHDVGPAIAPRLEQQLRETRDIHWHGLLPAHEVSRVLVDASYGVLRYATVEVAKSGIFAAYCAHGICPVLLAPSYPVHDGLRANEHYIAGASALGPHAPNARQIGMQAREWYLPHRAEAHAQALRSLLGTPSAHALAPV